MLRSNHISHFHLRKKQSGSFLIEMVVALGLLTGISMFLLIGSLDVMAPRNWIIMQNITDSYLTYEEAYAKRISFDEFTEVDSDWPLLDPDVTPTGETVDIGKVPGGRVISANVIRVRFPDKSNLISAGGEGTTVTNPAEMETWRLQTHLTYKIGNQDYVKSRTVVRTR